jgi:hypothetical protein
LSAQARFPLVEPFYAQHITMAPRAYASRSALDLHTTALEEKMPSVPTRVLEYHQPEAPGPAAEAQSCRQHLSNLSIHGLMLSGHSKIAARLYCTEGPILEESDDSDQDNPELSAIFASAPASFVRRFQV